MTISALLSQQRLAELLAVSQRTLERWRVEGSGPAFVKAGRRVLYRSDDVEHWIDSSRKWSTSEGGRQSWSREAPGPLVDLPADAGRVATRRLRR